MTSQTRIDDSSAELSRSRVWVEVSGQSYGGTEFDDVASAMRACAEAPPGAEIKRLADGEALFCKQADGSWLSVQAAAKVA